MSSIVNKLTATQNIVGLAIATLILIWLFNQALALIDSTSSLGVLIGVALLPIEGVIVWEIFRLEIARFFGSNS